LLSRGHRHARIFIRGILDAWLKFHLGAPPGFLEALRLSRDSRSLAFPLIIFAAVPIISSNRLDPSRHGRRGAPTADTRCCQQHCNAR
jgi:hypothetical protein